MNESTIPDNEFLFNKVKDLESAAAPNPEYHPGATETSVETSDMDYSDFAFGFSVSGAVVTVNKGYVMQGKRMPAQVIAADITITEDYTFIYVHFEFSAQAGTITSSTTRPSVTETTIDYPLHLWRLNDGVVTLADAGILHLGYIVIPGNFS